MGLIFGIGALLALICLWIIISPRSWWDLMYSWRYRDPRANRPSDASYAVSRIGAVLVLVVSMVAGWQLIGFDREDRARAAREDVRAERRRVFNAEAASLATLPAGSAGFKIKIYRYAIVDPSAGRPAYLSDFGKIPDGTNLVVALDGVYAPAGMSVDEKPGTVTVTLSGGCAPPPVIKIMCDPATGKAQAASFEPYQPITIVPVTLQAPLGSRKLVDGATGEAAVATR